MNKSKKTISRIYLWLFIVVSLATFILFCVIYFTFSGLGISGEGENTTDNKYYLNENFNQDDPYITKNPDLSDMLLGPIISDIDPSIGSPSAPVVIVLFSDYECEFCREQEDIVKAIIKDFDNQVRLIWKDYPENDPTSLSWQAAAGARCADEQDAYIAYHEGLFNKINFDENFILILAENLGLNIDQFEACLKSSRVAQLVNDNIEEANALDINGIPFIYINDQEVMGQMSYEDLERLVEIELKKISNF